MAQRKKVKSREYKVMLKREKFIGDKDELMKQAEEFWKDFKKAIKSFVVKTDGKLDNVKSIRHVRFYDSQDCQLRNNKYVFRERIDIKSNKKAKKKEITIKFRHPDRYISQTKEIVASGDKAIDSKAKRVGDTKFEEDIKLPFIKLYSHSTKQEIDYKKRLDKFSRIKKFYPEIKQRLKSFHGNTKLCVVGDFTARELVLDGATFQIRKSPKIEAGCALIVWYDESGKQDEPVVVEFSFNYENKSGEFSNKMAERAYEVFEQLNAKKEDPKKVNNKKLLDWIDQIGPTKTAFVYEKDRG